jgi:hypothetical protein
VSRSPATVCRQLLSALEAGDGRRRRRKRDTTPDALGMTIKRELLERALADDPPAEGFEAWLLEQCLADAPTRSMGAVRAMAREILDEYRLAVTLPAFDAWLTAGAPSEDRDHESRRMS